MIPTLDFGASLGEAFGEALIKLAKWALEEEEGRGGDGNDNDRTTTPENNDNDDHDTDVNQAFDSETDDEDAEEVIYTPDDSDSENYSATLLEEEDSTLGIFEGPLAKIESDSSAAVGADIGAMNAFTMEGVAVAKRIWGHFWSPQYKHFRTQTKTAETVGDWNGYTCWAYLIGLEAILEAERSAPGMFQTELREALLGMEKFWSPDHKAYCAWVWFNGNGDIYLDDNAQVAILLLLAHRLLPPPVGLPYRTYLERASQVVEFCLQGWDTANGGGIRWHVSTEGPPWTNRNACTTSLTAVAALELAATLREGGVPNNSERVRGLVAWGRRCVDWVWEELVAGKAGNSGGLVLDGLVQKQKGGDWVLDGMTYTYNTGHTITALVLLYDLLLPGDPHAGTVHLRATSLVISAIDRNKALYDTTVPNVQDRYWWDNNFFVHLLVEGLVAWGTRFGLEERDLWQQVRTELHREMTYLMTQLRDKDDGLYWRNFRLYTISMGHLSAYKALTGDIGRQPKLDAAERSQDAASMAKPVAQRGMVKTLLGCGGAGRALCIAGRVLL